LYAGFAAEPRNGAKLLPDAEALLSHLLSSDLFGSATEPKDLKQSPDRKQRLDAMQNS
jgi:hypothetical protein